MKRTAVFLLMGALYVLHNDLWAWDDPSLLLGLPIGLTYHVLFCLAVVGVMGLAIRWAWPPDLDPEAGPTPSAPTGAAGDERFGGARR
ncbi:MAG TPA: hypothetical protein VMV46_18000 [Thermoanaerobaculia bacterium]|nr:hypothetical protein [Thermoanaerobaculia bacterium]